MVAAARVFAGITAESIAQSDAAITLPQLRVLVLASRLEPLNATAVAVALDVHLSSASRICERLVQAGLLHRRDRPDDRRQLELTLTEEGRRALNNISEHRRRVFTRILRRIDAAERMALSRALDGFIEAAQEYDTERSLAP
jgi:DNA-binding MarR family transcriptional regulator